MEDQISSPNVSPTTQPPAKKSNKSCILIAVIGILIILVLAAGGFWAYAKFVKKASSIKEVLNSASEMIETKNFNSDCKYDDTELCKFMNNWENVASYSMDSTTTEPDGQKSTSVIKIDGEDKTQIISSENGKENYNTITIGETYYQKDYADGKWFKYTLDKTDTTDSTIENDIKYETPEITEQEDTTTYKRIGQEDCGSLKCWKYQVIDNVDTSSNEFIYFDNKEYLLRKSRSEQKDGTITDIVYNYTKVTIDEPSPTKEGSPYESYTGSASESSVSQDLEGENVANNDYLDGSVSTDSTDAEDYSSSVEESE